MDKKDLPSISAIRKKIYYEPKTGALRSTRTNSEVFTNVHHSGYLKGAVLGRTFTAHRVAMALAIGEWPDGEVDHINGDRADNRLENLRVVTKAQNQRNAKRRVDNKTGHVGVCMRRNRWIAYINKNGVRHNLGTFDKKDDAINARKAAQEKLGGFSDRHGAL